MTLRTLTHVAVHLPPAQRLKKPGTMNHHLCSCLWRVFSQGCSAQVGPTGLVLCEPQARLATLQSASVSSRAFRRTSPWYLACPACPAFSVGASARPGGWLCEGRTRKSTGWCVTGACYAYVRTLQSITYSICLVSSARCCTAEAVGRPSVFTQQGKPMPRSCAEQASTRLSPNQ